MSVGLLGGDGGLQAGVENTFSPQQGPGLKIGTLVKLQVHVPDTNSKLPELVSVY